MAPSSLLVAMATPYVRLALVFQTCLLMTGLDASYYGACISTVHSQQQRWEPAAAEVISMQQREMLRNPSMLPATPHTSVGDMRETKTKDAT